MAEAIRKSTEHGAAGSVVGEPRADLDRVDLAILRLLAGDARMSGRRLAREVGMSAPAVAERVARLERTGVIRGYRAEVDRAALGLPLVVYVGAVAVQGADQQKVVERLRTMAEVEDVHIVTGPKDLLIRLRVRDPEHLREALFDRIWNVPGMERTETYISLSDMEPKSFDADRLAAMMEDGSAGRPVRAEEERGRV
jgi:Lrp/AsnC family leucine-responsive transcriptional regulator